MYTQYLLPFYHLNDHPRQCLLILLRIANAYLPVQSKRKVVFLFLFQYRLKFESSWLGDRSALLDLRVPPVDVGIVGCVCGLDLITGYCFRSLLLNGEMWSSGINVFSFAEDKKVFTYIAERASDRVAVVVVNSKVDPIVQQLFVCQQHSWSDCTTVCVSTTKWIWLYNSCLCVNSTSDLIVRQLFVCEQHS